MIGASSHLITDANGIPLACLTTGANAHDVTQLLPLVEAIPPIRGVVGRPRRRPSVLLADRGTAPPDSRRATTSRTSLSAKANRVQILSHDLVSAVGDVIDVVVLGVEVAARELVELS